MQAVLILAHKDVNQIIRLTQKLHSFFNVYIHFDKKYKILNSDQDKLKHLGATVISEVEVNWGSWSIGEATLNLMKLALENEDNSFFHIISGQDWPVVNPQKIYNFYEHNDKIYMKYDLAKNIRRSGENILLWQKYYFNYDSINRRSFLGKVYHRLSLGLQTLFRVDKLKKLGISLEIYHGANWVDLPRDAVEYLVDFLPRHQNLYTMLKTGCFSDEFWMQTILCNNDFFCQRIVKNNHRFIKWEKKYGNYPAVLDADDLNEILKGDYQFARKFDSLHSRKLIEMLNNMR
ncbi:beta-1,6-N-acetylglucosaminyltransferase [Liquorilactobacillus vini]|uniref:Peptide O-xylosyltransferase n=2 Tax=Lactobacillaceae TaxID=33958 RepID=A0A0R2C917_9LACO|nr:beta-1,6-N-acetylglucosaminyltransferase [Liquorilactobacillus vini]KRM86468.1 hypothetical protein FD21_GL001525 [Liquorilactobacillus vini DSM 20605]